MCRGDLLRRMEEGIRNQVLAGRNGDDDAFILGRLPPRIREINRSLFEPVMVSIGPYHPSSESTSTMQLYNWRLLNEFLLRGETCILQACIEAVRATEPRARRFYGEALELGSDAFVEMVVLDGCFILEYLIKWSENNAGCSQAASICIYYDLLLAENELPFFVLRQLFSLRNAAHRVDQAEMLFSRAREVPCTGAPSDSYCFTALRFVRQVSISFQSVLLSIVNRNHIDTQRNTMFSCTGCPVHGTFTTLVDQGLLDLIYKFFSLLDPPGQVRHAGAPTQVGAVYHLLHLQYQRIVMTLERRRPRQIMRIGAIPPFAIPCVTRLQEWGVTFKEKVSPASQFDVTFRSGTMEIPRLVINGGTTTLLANLFALEQTQDFHERTVTDYLLLMNALVHTSADVAVLQSRRVLDNNLSNEEEAATFFNQLGGVAVFDPRVHQFARLFRDTNEYCDSRWNRYMAVFKRDHLQSPCSIINLLVAAILLFVSVMSVGYVICRYRHICS